jgi:hypothetical protein
VKIPFHFTEHTVTFVADRKFNLTRMVNSLISGCSLIGSVTKTPCSSCFTRECKPNDMNPSVTLRLNSNHTPGRWRFKLITPFKAFQGSSVSIATDYGLDGPGIESRWGRDFPHLSRPALGPTQPTVQWVPVFPGAKERPGCAVDLSSPSSAVVMED